MKYFALCGLALLVAATTWGCEDKSTPESSNDGQGLGGSTSSEKQDEESEKARKGERGDSCDSTNDCADGLSCIVSSDCPAGIACANKSCQPSNFEIIGTGKQCHITQCATQADCCGDMVLEQPAKCSGREVICSQPTLTGCLVTTCASDADCDGGGTCGGRCSLDGEACLIATDCAQNTCDLSLGSPGTCTISGASCTSDVDCAQSTCSVPRCDCTNPDYDRTADICTDEECDSVCGYTCEDERCVVDTSCDQDTDCALATPYCEDAACVECRTSDDCDDEECIAGRCGPECEVDSECSVFETCQENECVYVGCQSDRECVLGLSASNPTQDPRLSVCVVEEGVGTCVFPCEIDAQCAPTEVCLDGVCEYIGCETDAECKTIVGLHNQPVSTDERPWTTKAVCRAENETP